MSEDRSYKSPYRNIFEAAKNGSIDDIRFFVENEGIDVNIKCDNAGETVLQFALKNEQDIEILKYLVEKGININTKDKYGRTPMHSALTKFNVEVLDYLFDHGADINVIDGYGQTLLTCAVYGWSEIHSKERYLDFELLQYLVKKGADLNRKDKYGETLLHDFVRSELGIDVIRYLIENGADVNAISFAGYSPLDLAKTEEITALLVEAGGVFAKKL